MPALSPPPAVADGFYHRHGKRWLDLLLAGPALVLLTPALLLLALLVRLSLGAPVLFRQDRVGRDELVFRLNKLRTMTDARDPAGRLLPDERRLTRLGLFLRRWSLDELPQLVNVLKGEMSLVGPRPLLIRYLPRYSLRQRRRHAVRPGLTGWAQIHGRNRLSWAERFEHDLWYAAHCSLRLDLAILLATVRRGLDGKDVVATGAGEVLEFWGETGPPAGAPLSLPSEERGA